MSSDDDASASDASDVSETAPDDSAEAHADADEPTGDDEGDGPTCTYHEGALDFDPEERDRPMLVWDGDCGFCARSVERLKDQVGDRVRYAPYQKIHEHIEGLEPSDFEEAVHLVWPDGTHCRAAEAIFRTLAMAPGHGYWLWLYEHVPGFDALTERGYEWVAEHRPTASTIAKWLIGSDLKPSKRHLSRWLFLRLLAAILVVAFLSFWAQFDGLIGSEGILPAVEHVDRMREAIEQRHPGEALFGHMPTFFAWFEPTDRLLGATCLAGAALGGAIFVGIWPRLLLGLSWFLYLSLVQVGGVFFGYQWDALLLEATLLGVFLAPSGVWPRGGERRPSGAALFLTYWLLFRLMFMSGVVKILGHGVTWREGTALTYHFWTQPLPAWTGYYAHYWPDVLLTVGTYGTLVLELAVPFCIFGPRWLQRWTAVALASLQIAILATGNYCFFNILTLALCLLLVDDRTWRRWLPAALVERIEPDDAPVSTADAAPEPPIRRYGHRARQIGWGALVVGVVGVTSVNMIDRFQRGGASLTEQLPESVSSSIEWIGRWRTLNNYGLFADMTTDRPELIVQGSRDGESWKTYRFKWKPDALDERPGFVQPHQPRLDWQMWFQALRQQRAHEHGGRCGASRWFLNFQKRLLQGRESVEALLERVPFEGEPPRYVRAVMYRYEFTRPGDETDRWWRRTRLGQYCPTVTLRDGRLAPVRRP
jgi:predicted DCC family thiol-disulfide oxidoreductase YuxK